MAAGTPRTLLLLATVLSLTLSLAVAEKVTSRTSSALAASARQRVASGEGATAAATIRLRTFLAQVRGLHGQHRAENRIRALARSLESKDCVYDQELKDTQAAVQKFAECVARIQGIAKATLDSAEERGRLNEEYGRNSEASLSHISNAVKSLNDLQRSIVTEHKVAADHLAQEVLAIKSQVGEIWWTNEDARRAKKWNHSMPPGYDGGEAQVETTKESTDEQRPGFQTTEDQGGKALVQEDERPVRKAVPARRTVAARAAARGREGPLFIKASPTEADSEEDAGSDGESLAQLKEELRTVQTKLAQAERRGVRGRGEEDS